MIIGLATQEVTRTDSEGNEVTFVLRKALSPYECEQAAEQVGFRGINAILAQSGKDGLRDVIDALNTGETPKSIAERLNKGQTVPEDEESAADREARDKALRAQYDLDWAAAKLVKRWSYRDEDGRRIPVKIEYIRLLEAPMRSWLHDRTWAAMRQHLPDEHLAGNS